MALGVTQQSPGVDKHIMTEPELSARLRVLMAGYVAEHLVFGNVSTGAQSDLKEATELASRMVAQYGMSRELGAVYYEYASEHPFLGQRMPVDGSTSDTTLSAIESETRSMLDEARRGAEVLISSHRDALDALVGVLLERETVERDELVRLLGLRASAGDGSGVRPRPGTRDRGSRGSRERTLVG
jgi:cell division protease FtsH